MGKQTTKKKKCKNADRNTFARSRSNIKLSNENKADIEKKISVKRVWVLHYMFTQITKKITNNYNTTYAKCKFHFLLIAVCCWCRCCSYCSRISMSVMFGFST